MRERWQFMWLLNIRQRVGRPQVFSQDSQVVLRLFSKVKSWSRLLRPLLQPLVPLVGPPSQWCGWSCWPRPLDEGNKEGIVHFKGPLFSSRGTGVRGPTSLWLLRTSRVLSRNATTRCLCCLWVSFGRLGPAECGRTHTVAKSAQYLRSRRRYV